MLIAAKNFPAMRFGGRILYSKTASEVDRRAMQLLKVLDTKKDHSGRAFIGFDIEWRPSFRKGIYANFMPNSQTHVYCFFLTLLSSCH